MFSPQGIMGGRAAIFAAAVELNCGVVRRRGGDSAGVAVGEATPTIPAPDRARAEGRAEAEARCLLCCLGRA